MIIAIDGPAGSGKSTIARQVARCLGLGYLDTGAMYRAVTLLALEAGLLPERVADAAELARSMAYRVEDQTSDAPRIFVDGRDVTDAIRTPFVSQHVSMVAADAQVRRVLLETQRRATAGGDMVLEGRDMGTVVCPCAHLKVFLTASIEERARRRRLQLMMQGIQQPQADLEQEIESRDHYDSTRTVAPLRQAEDAVVIDTTDLTIDEVVDSVCRYARAVTEDRG